MLNLVASGDRRALADYLSGEIASVARAGATIGLLASNTPHLVFDDLQRVSPIPLISIVEATCAEVEKRGLTKVALLGTRFTMEGRFYPDVLMKRGITVVVPTETDRAYVHEHYLGELVAGVYRPETRDEVLAIVERMRSDEGIEAVILGGTELPLLFRDGPPPPIPLLDTTGIHVEAAVAKILS